MPRSSNEPAASASPAITCPQAARRVGCVSYLNARPLIDGLDRTGGEDEDTDRGEGADEGAAALTVRYAVPAQLLGDLEAGAVDIALCPVIDYHRARMPLTIVPAGGIGCAGATLTVRLFSRVPIERVRRVHVDIESHTSVALLRVLLAERFHRHPELLAYDAHEREAEGAPETMLLIGDKVVTDAPADSDYPHQLDLGEAWQAMTGLPFVFAVWMAARDTDLGDLPGLLDRQRRRNADRIDRIVQEHAPRHHWPRDLARHYLGAVLRFAIGAPELEAIERFSALAARHGMIETARPLVVHPLT